LAEPEKFAALGYEVATSKKEFVKPEKKLVRR